MPFVTSTVNKKTKGPGDMVDLTADVQQVVEENGGTEGQVTVFVVGSTAGISTIEFEPGLVKDMDEALEKVAPKNADYHHHQTWGDYNGYGHVRATVIGPSITVPFDEGRLLLGTWQQIVLMEFDDRPRQREIVVQLLS